MKRNFPQDWVIILLAACLFFLCSCRTQIPIARADTVTKVLIKERVHDTTIYVTDSAGFKALLECDSLGMVRVKQIQNFYAGQFVRPKVVVKDNYIKLDCKVDSAKIYASWKERDTVKVTSTSQTIVVKENYITGFQWAQIWAGRVFILLVLLYAGFKALKLYKPF